MTDIRVGCNLDVSRCQRPREHQILILRLSATLFSDKQLYKQTRQSKSVWSYILPRRVGTGDSVRRQLTQTCQLSPPFLDCFPLSYPPHPRFLVSIISFLVSPKEFWYSSQWQRILRNLLSITKLFQHAKLYLAPAGKSGSFVMGANFFLKV